MGECFEQENVFPIIREIVEQICQDKANALSKRMESMNLLEKTRMETRVMKEGLDFALHEDIAKALQNHGKGHTEILSAVKRCPQHSEEWLADNMVQWWSQRFSTGRNDWSHHFDRRKVNGNWAYKTRKRI
ncbi:MAG: hypothetical protein ACJ8CR_33750 [Roseiflexaceae bacterium]